MTNNIMKLADEYAESEASTHPTWQTINSRAALLAEVERVSKDAERLNWLDKQGYAYGFEDMHEGNKWEIEGPFMSIRGVIDTAMQGEKS